MKIKSRFNWDSIEGLRFRKPSRTAQQFAAEADINEMLRRYQSAGVAYDPAAIARAAARPVFADLTNVPVDFQEAQNLIIQAREAFEGLGSDVRARFANDPGKLMAFLANEENNEEAYKLGLKVRPVAPTPVEPTKVIVVNPDNSANGGAQ